MSALGRPFPQPPHAPSSGKTAAHLSSGEIRTLNSLIQMPVMESEKSELEKMLVSKEKGQFEQESLAAPASIIGRITNQKHL